MKQINRSVLFFLSLLIVSCSQNSENPSNTEDIKLIKDVISNYDKAWDAKNLEQVLDGYSEDIDWTNAFGDRVQGKKELKSLLETIFSLDFVMSGKNNYEEPEITFLNNNIAIARSVNIRKGQKWPDGSLMKDRVINHLRVFKYINGKWLCVSHMISQAHEKEGK